MKHVILTEDDQGNILAVLVPATNTWHETQDLRDVLEMTFGYETRGITEVITLADAKRRAKQR